MTWKADKDRAIGSLTEILHLLARTKAEDLAHTARLSADLDFSAAVPVFKQIISLLQKLEKSDLWSLPTSHIGRLTDACRNIHKQFHELQRFDRNHDDPEKVRDGLIGDVENILGQNLSVLTSAIASSGQDEAAIQRLRAEVTERVKIIEAKQYQSEAEQKQVDSRVKAAKEIVGQAKEIRDQAKKMAATEGVVAHAKHFQEEAERCRKSSWIWLFATSVSAVVAAIISVCAINQTISDVSGWVALVQMIVGRFSLMALAYFVTIWLSRMYRAARHNEVVNRHRVNALRTFETFASAARDDAAKDAVLMRATECIFHHQSSGFADNKSEPGSTRLVGSLPQTLPGSSSAASPSSQGDAGP